MNLEKKGDYGHLRFYTSSFVLTVSIPIVGNRLKKNIKAKRDDKRRTTNFGQFIIILKFK